MVQKTAKSKNQCPAGITADRCVHQVEIIYSAPEFVFEKSVTASEHLEELFRHFYDARKIALKEYFYVVLLNTKFQCIGYSLIGIGNQSCVTVDVKEILQLAILSHAAAIAVSHNHPSGSSSPSVNDISMTKKIKAGAEIFGIEFLDHLILTADGYYSFADEGVM